MLLDQSAQIAEWNGLKLSVNQLRALGELKARELDKDTKFSGGLSIAPMNLREFLAGIGVTLPAMADANTLGKFELNTLPGRQPQQPESRRPQAGSGRHCLQRPLRHRRFRQAIAARPAQGRQARPRPLPAGQGQASPGCRQRHAQGGSRRHRGQCRPGQHAATGKPTRQAWSDAPLLPIATLRKLDLDVALNFGRLTVEKLPIDDASLKLRGQGGVISLDDMRGGLYNGRFNAKANLDVRQDSAVLTATKHIANVPVERLLEAQGKKPPVKGLLDLDADIRTSGNSEKSWIDHLNGNARFSLINGVLPDANLEQQLCQGIATLNRKALAGTHGGKGHAFPRAQGQPELHQRRGQQP